MGIWNRHSADKMVCSVPVSSRTGGDGIRLKAADRCKLACGPQDMEDVGGCEEALLGAAQPAVLCSIFDGHCGRGAAMEALTALPAALAERLPAASAGLADGSGAGAAWQDAFQEADRGLRSEEGCTATAILAWLDAQGSVCLQVALLLPTLLHE